jgi:hypothetical protein
MKKRVVAGLFCLLILGGQVALFSTQNFFCHWMASWGCRGPLGCVGDFGYGLAQQCVIVCVHGEWQEQWQCAVERY